MPLVTIEGNIRGFSDGPYVWTTATHNGKPIHPDEPFEVKPGQFDVHLCALDRQDVERCFFTVSGEVRDDQRFYILVAGPCVCFHLMES